MATFVIPDSSSGKKLYRGDHIVFEAALSQAKKALAITGYTIWFTAKPNISLPDGGSGVIQKTIGNGITVLDASQGKIRIGLVPADTAGINQETKYECDVQVKSPTNEVSTVARGTVTVSIDVTQAT